MITNLVPEAVGTFATETALRDAADELLQSGFDRSALSVLGDEDDVRRVVGRNYDHIREIEDMPGLPRHPYSAGDSRVEAEAGITGGLGYVGAVGAAAATVASGGALTPVLLAALAGGGGGALVGGAIASLLHRRHADNVRAHLQRGGLALFVETDEEADESKAMMILARHGAADVHMHNVHISPALWSRSGVSYDASFMNLLRL